MEVLTLFCVIVGEMKMPWNLEFDSELNFIITVYSGDVTKQDIEESTKASLSKVHKDRPALFLTEFEDVVLRLTTLDIYSVFEQWIPLGATRENRSALVVSESSSIFEDVKFHETVCRNRSWKVRVFRDREEAMNWLFG